MSDRDAGPRASGRELLRKSIHIALGFLALGLRWTGPWPAACAALIAAALNLRFVHWLTGGVLLRPAERARGASRGVTWYPLAVALVIGAFHRRLELAAGVWGLLAFGDGIAAIAGQVVGGPGLPWNPRKSWIGLLAFVSWGTCAAALLIRWTQGAILDAAASGSGRVVHHVGASFLNTIEAGAPETALLLLGCLVAATAAGLAESADSRVDDNLRVVLAGGSVLYAASLVEPWRLSAAGDAFAASLALGAVLNLVLAAVAVALGGVDRPGAATGAALGTLLFGISGWRGYVLLCGLFALGTAATRIRSRRKEAAGLGEPRRGRRGAGQALANAGAGVAFAILGATTAHRGWFDLAMVAAFATATADTVGSEIGKAFGARPWLPISLRRVEPGTPGAISLAGTLAGSLAGALISGAAWASGILGPSGFACAAAGAVTGSAVESLLGAHGAARPLFGHDALNAINTLAGAAAACLVALALP